MAIPATVGACSKNSSQPISRQNMKPKAKTKDAPSLLYAISTSDVWVVGSLVGCIFGRRFSGLKNHHRPIKLHNPTPTHAHEIRSRLAKIPNVWSTKSLDWARQVAQLPTIFSWGPKKIAECCPKLGDVLKSIASSSKEYSVLSFLLSSYSSPC